MRRWVCPRCKKGKIAPNSPATLDVRRWCLPCSEETGRLVERTCPARDRENARRAASRSATSRRRREAAERRDRDRHSFDGLDVRVETRRLLRLKAWNGHFTGRTPPNVEVVRSRTPGTSGKAFPWGNSIRLIFEAGNDRGTEAPETTRRKRSELRALIAHELAHLVARIPRPRGGSGRRAWHGQRWRELFRAAVAEETGVHIPTGDRTLPQIWSDAVDAYLQGPEASP